MKTNVTNWIIDNIENGKLDENQVIVVYDKNNNIEYLGKAQFAPLNLWEEFKTAEIVGHELRINERHATFKKPHIVALQIVGEHIIKTATGFKVDKEHYIIRAQMSDTLNWEILDFIYPRNEKGLKEVVNRAHYIATNNTNILMNDNQEIPVYMSVKV